MSCAIVEVYVLIEKIRHLIRNNLVANNQGICLIHTRREQDSTGNQLLGLLLIILDENLANRYFVPSVNMINCKRLH